MLFEVKNGTVSLGGSEILSHFNFRMVDAEKIGIVGRNGAGKTTLLKFMNGEIGLDYNDDNTMGEIVKSKDYNVGFLRQQLAGTESRSDGLALLASTKVGDGEGQMVSNSIDTAYQYLLSAFDKLIEMESKIDKITNELSENYDDKKATELNKLIDTYNFEGGHTYVKELKTGFKKFGFTENDLEKPLNEFSGGQATKISLLRLLLSKPDVLLLDEPTNHLDIEAIEWMEEYLQSYKKNVVIVSHDRMFLDNICNVIYDIENKLAERYDGNYTDFVEQKEINYQLKLAEYNKNLKEIERLTALADRFRYKATKAKMVQSKDKVIEKLEAKTFKPLDADTKTFQVKIVPNKTGGKEVLRCTNLVVGYENAIAKVNLIVNRRDRLAVIGANGTGKSTFIKTIVGVIPKLSGDFEYGHEIEYEYFDQRIAENNSTKTIFEDFSDEFPTYNNTEVRNRLGRFLFGEEDIAKRVCDLSGGEKVRLCLSKIFERKPNLLILDEPTNHLDILGKESLEEILNNFEGTVVFVSHDRYFVKKISNKVLYFEKAAQQVGGDIVGATHREPAVGESLLSAARFFEFGYEDYEKYIKEVNDDNVAHTICDDGIGAVGTSTASSDVGASTDSPHVDSLNKTNYELNKQKNKNQKKAKKLEEEIADIENEIDELNKSLEDEKIQTNFEELNNINIKIKELSDLLEDKYDEWGSLT